MLSMIMMEASKLLPKHTKKMRKGLKTSDCILLKSFRVWKGWVMARLASLSW